MIAFPSALALVYFEALWVPSRASRLCRHKQWLVPQAGPAGYLWAHPFSSPSGSHLCVRSHWVSRGLKRGGREHLAYPSWLPVPNLPHSGLFANCSWREPHSQPSQALLLAPLSAHGLPFPS